MQTEAIFENIGKRICEEIEKANDSIYIAVAWFTNEIIFNKLRQKARKGCQIKIIISDDNINENSRIDFHTLERYNCQIFKIGNGDTELMHNKFCVIDLNTVITGSYNWSYKAESNYENIVINTKNTILAEQFITEFYSIVSKYYPDYHETVNEITRKYNDFTLYLDAQIATENSKKQLVREIFKRNPKLFIDLISQFYEFRLEIFLKIKLELKYQLLFYNKHIPFIKNTYEISENEIDWNKEIENFQIISFIGIIKTEDILKKTLYKNSNGFFYRVINVNITFPDCTEINYNLSLFESIRLENPNKFFLNAEISTKWKLNNPNIIICDVYKPNIKKRINPDGTIFDVIIEGPNMPEEIPLLDQISYLEENGDKIGWSYLSETQKLNWSCDLINYFSDKWDWKILSKNKYLPWSENLIEQHLENWHWGNLSMNRHLPWNLKIIEKYKRKWEWDILSFNRNLPWSENFIERYAENWYWEILSYNENIPWDESFIERHDEFWNWKHLIQNKKINWSVKLIHNYSDKIESSENIWNTLNPYVDDEMIIELLEDIKNQ